MAIQNVAFRAYQAAIDEGSKFEKRSTAGGMQKDNEVTSFSDTITQSVKKVNDLQEDKSRMIEAFASGEEQNVHELMIQLQKAGLAMSMTSAVRNKVMDAYKQIMQMPF